MIVPDVNLLLYAANASSAHHDVARDWWERTLTSAEPVGLPWVVTTGFLRIVTNEQITSRPYAVGEALDIVDGWFSAPGVTAIGPGRRHATLLRGFLEQLGRGAKAVPDAHIAAIVVEHEATLYSSDRGFGQYQGLRWVDPLAQ